jgi:acetyl-CoA acyltransferase 1
MEAKNCTVPMGMLSEKMAKDRGVSRKDQDAFAASSYQKALKAQKEGLFDEEIYPLTVKWEDPKTEQTKEITVARDDGVREGITAESLSKIRPAFAKDGSIHAGNASQVSDGAAAVLLMKRSKAQELGQPILGKFVSASVVGVPPLLMGIGPWKAIPVALAKAGINKNDVDIYEVNEAFASQCLWCAKELGLDLNKVNPKGGAIAFGHPLGCTGARQISTLLYELRRRGEKVGVTSMCIGTVSRFPRFAVFWGFANGDLGYGNGRCLGCGVKTLLFVTGFISLVTLHRQRVEMYSISRQYRSILQQSHHAE